MWKSLAVLAASLPVSGALAQGFIETPDKTTSYTGIGVISGWHCSARRIEIAIDSYPRFVAPSGSDRQDTAGVCGRADTGFAYTINYNDLPSGPHNIVAFADGVEFARDFFVTVNLPARGGAAATFNQARNYIYEFPRRGLKTELIWSEATQNFGINVVTENPAPLARAQGRNSGMARLSTPTEIGRGESCTFANPTYTDSPVEADVAIEATGRARLSFRFATGKSCSVSGEVRQTTYGTGELRSATSDCFDRPQSRIDVAFTDAATTNSSASLQPGVQYPLELRITANDSGFSFESLFCGVKQFLSVMLWPSAR